MHLKWNLDRGKVKRILGHMADDRKYVLKFNRSDKIQHYQRGEVTTNNMLSMQEVGGFLESLCWVLPIGGRDN